MAGRKEYEMLFRLNAQMNGGFSGTFSKAQNEFTRLGKEIQNLQRVQGDVRSYQKQQSAVEATRTKLANLQRQHDLLQQEIKETNGSTAGLEREDAKLTAQIQSTQAALERQQQKLDGTGARLKAAEVKTTDLAKKDAELTEKIRDLTAQQDRAAEGAVSFGERASQALGAVGNIIATAGIAAGLREIGQAVMECVDVAADFEEAMSTVAALSQANAQDMAALTAEAKELGATTKYTAKESADAMGFMAMAGWDASEMMAGMDSVLKLASASGEDLAQTSDIVTDNLTAFGLTAADTGHFADVLAAAATSSNTSVAIMGETFKSSASVAGALGYSIEDVATAVGLMANAGVKGSRAGTALRNIFNGLLEGVTLSGAAFGEMEYTTVKADGTMKSFSETIEDLRGVFDQMTEAERVNNAITVAGERGYNGLLAILNSTEQDYRSLADTINNCAGAAGKMAEIKLDNLNGDLTIMKSAWDALKMTIGEQFTPVLRKAYVGLTDVFGTIDLFVQNHPATMKAATAFVGVIGAATAALTAYAAISKVVKALDLASSFSVAGPIMLGVGAVAALTAGIAAWKSKVDESLPAVEELNTALDDSREAMAAAKDELDDTAAGTEANALIAERYLDKLQALSAAGEMNEERMREYSNTLELLKSTVPEVADGIELTTDGLVANTQAVRENIEAYAEKAKQEAYQKYLADIQAQYSDVMQKVTENEIKLTEARTKREDAEAKAEKANAQMRNIEAAAQKKAEEQNKRLGSANAVYWRDMIGFMGAEGEAYQELEAEVAGYNATIGKAREEEEEYQAAIDAAEPSLREMEEAMASGQEAIDKLTGAVSANEEATEDNTGAQTALQTALDGVYADLNELTVAYTEAYNAALESVSGQYAIWDDAADIIPTDIDAINASLGKQVSYWQEYNANLQSLADRTDDIEGLSAVIASFADGSSESVNAVAGMAKASDEDLASMVASWNSLKTEQETVSGSIADITTDYEDAIDDFQTALSTEIGEMDLEAEAKQSAIDTIQGYIDGASGMLPQVRRAFKNVSMAAEKAIFGYAGGTGGPIDYDPTPEAVADRGYAAGTESAAPGLALVGEAGPELVRFHGGEAVLDAGRTANALRGFSGAETRQETTHVSSTPVQVTFQISGDATPETVRDLRSFAEEITGRVLAAVDEASEDSRRRRY